MELVSEILPLGAVGGLAIAGFISWGKLTADVRHNKQEITDLGQGKVDKNVCSAQYGEVIRRLKRIEHKQDAYLNGYSNKN